MRATTGLLGVLLLGAGCGSEVDVAAVQTAAVATAFAERTTDTSTPTDAPEPTSTPRVTDTPRPTNTPWPTNTPRPTATPTSTPAPGFARTNPAPLGVPIVAMVDAWEGNGYVEHEYRVKVLEVLRGEDAWNVIRSASTLSEPPPPDKDYLLAWVTVDFLRSTGEEAEYLYTGDWDVLSNGRLYSILDLPSLVLEPDPTFDGRVFPGGSVEGWVLLPVVQADPDPLLVWREQRGGIWFCTTMTC